MNFGFIITRHVNSEKTNMYWNQCVKLLRTYYPKCNIIIIDDNSNQNFVKADFAYKNTFVVQSEYPGRGELLPYIYFIKNDWFENAVIIHDSVFFHQRINFERFQGIKVLPLWHFNQDKENIYQILNLSNVLSNNYHIQKKLTLNDHIMGLNFDRWYGCFGVQSYIQLDFLTLLANKYNLFNLLTVVKCRPDRCCLERIFGTIFITEYPSLLKQKSLFGDIFNYQTWGYSYDQYENDIKQKRLPKYIVKIWTGR
jgi:hypothetical protein